jgi:DNA-binding transcriptional MerR regulator
MSRGRAADQEIGYSPLFACKIARVDYDVLLSWIRNKLIRASIRLESDKWSPVLFSFGDLLEIVFIRLLKDGGCPTRKIKKALALLRKNVRKGFSELYIVIFDDDIRCYADTDGVLAAVKSMRSFLLVNVGKVQDELESRLRLIAGSRARPKKAKN